MGYDMFTRGAEGCTDPDHKDHYLRRALGNGGALARELVNAGMGEWGDDELFLAAERDGFPVPPETLERDESTDEWVGEDAQDYIAKLEAYLSDRRGAGRGVAVWKLCNTNDGWHVTQAECDEAMAAWEEAGRPAMSQDDIIPFLRAGADHDGFEVH